MKTEITPLTNVIDLPSQIEQLTAALTVSELARLVRISAKKIYPMVSRGEIPNYRIGGSIRFDPKRIADWLRSQSA